jgi:hypothetical protein
MEDVRTGQQQSILSIPSPDEEKEQHCSSNEQEKGEGQTGCESCFIFLSTLSIVL